MAYWFTQFEPFSSGLPAARTLVLNDIISLLKLKKGDIVVVTRVGRGFIWCRVGLKAGKSGLGTSMF